MNGGDGLVDRLEGLFRRNAGRIFIEQPNAPAVTFGSAWEQSARYANLFAAYGVAPGERIVMKAQKSVQVIMVYLACLRSGVIFLPVNPAFKGEETDHIFRDATPKIVIIEETDAAFPDAVVMATDVAAREAASHSALFSRKHPKSDAPAVILYTSGTTGRPKGATLSHGNILANALSLVAAWRFDADDVLLHALPLFHSHGLFVSLSCSLLTASRIILLDRFDPDRVISEMSRASVFMGVPTMYVRLAEDEKLTPALCRSIRLFASGSAALSPKTFMRFESRTGRRIVERYGMTETAINSSNPLDGDRRAGTVGRHVDGVEIEIRDASGRALSRGAVGGVHVRGPHVFLGYWGKPEQTAAVKTADGWFATGDIGTFDGQGYLTLVGRSKDLIITGGYNVYPAEVERVLDRHPGIRESAVVGLPHEDFGEAVTAVATTEEDAFPSEAAIREMAKQHLAGYKVPKRIVFVDELPRNHLGKIDKTVLRARYEDLYLQA